MTADFASLQTFPRLFSYFLTRCVSIIFQLTKESIRLKNRAATKKKKNESNLFTWLWENVCHFEKVDDVLIPERVCWTTTGGGG